MKTLFSFLFSFLISTVFSQISENYQPLFQSNFFVNNSSEEFHLISDLNTIQAKGVTTSSNQGFALTAKKLELTTNLKTDIENAQSTNPNIYGKRLEFNVDFINSSVKYQKDNYYVYLLKLELPSDSEANQFLFSKFSLSDNSKFFIYNFQHDILGAYTKKSYNNTSQNTAFATQPITGTQVILELNVPINEDSKNEIKLNNIVSIPLYNFNGGQAGDCHVDVTSDVCNSDQNNNIIKNNIKAVGLMLLPVYSGNQTYNAYCSGVLLNNTLEDRTPYFLTARHCANSFELQHPAWNEELIVMFNHEKNKGTIVDINKNNNTVLGADVLSEGGSTSDYTFLRLRADKNVLETYKVGYAGWDAEFKQPASKSKTYGVSHPKGDYKKLTTFNDLQYASSKHGERFPYGHFLSLDKNSKIIHASWGKGIVEAGSSGSPLYYNNQVVGILSFGPKYNVKDWQGYPDETSEFTGCKAPELYNVRLNQDKNHTFNLYTAGYVSFSSFFNNIAPYLAPGSTKRSIKSLPYNDCADITLGPTGINGGGNGNNDNSSISEEHKLRRSENIYVDDPIDTFGTLINLEKVTYFSSNLFPFVSRNSEKDGSDIILTGAKRINNEQIDINVLHVNNDATSIKDKFSIYDEDSNYQIKSLRFISMKNNNLIFYVYKVNKNNYKQFAVEYRIIKYNNSTKLWETKKYLSFPFETHVYKIFRDGSFITTDEKSKKYYLNEFSDTWKSLELKNLEFTTNYRVINRISNNEFIYINKKDYSIPNISIIKYNMNNEGRFTKVAEVFNVNYNNKEYKISELNFRGYDSDTNTIIFSTSLGDLLLMRFENNTLNVFNKIFVVHGLSSYSMRMYTKEKMIFQNESNIIILKSNDNWNNTKVYTIKNLHSPIFSIQPKRSYIFTSTFSYTFNYDGNPQYIKNINIKETEYLTDNRFYNDENFTQIGNYYITSLDLKNYDSNSFHNGARLYTNTEKSLVYFNGGSGDKAYSSNPVHTLILGPKTSFGKNATTRSFIFYAKNKIVLKPGFSSNKSYYYFPMKFIVTQKNSYPINSFMYNPVINPIFNDVSFKPNINNDIIDIYGKNRDFSNITSYEIQNKSIENIFTISPNPTSSHVQINSTIGINEWFIYDINAKVVLSGNNKNTTALKVNLQSLPIGLYYFKFTDNAGKSYEKTIIKK
ncbi:T9SS type A sorting domain-containing protein [Empedobacter tilapiae]|uniref:T9SS type A sorting domain-containing protein n=1 Tax=Empedobacter tilapiae TaxID=2491114 RepID=UPI0028D322E5|nr:T9SS type A sorting domain-containing protein [Empedobacter tilapiae]